MKNPEIRFVDDNGDWKEKLLGTTLSLTTGKLDANAAVKDGRYAFFTCGKQQLLTNTFSFAGDAILINGNGDLGYTRRYSGLFDAYQRTYVLQNFKENFEFIELSIKRKLPSKIKEEAIGGAMPYIRADTISNLKIHLPTLKTQQKISSLLSNIDQKINAEEDLIQKLKDTKSAMLSKMFPRENQSVPELRFVGFVDAWEQRKLGGMVSLITKGTTPLDKSNTGVVNFVKIESIDESSGNITITQKISLDEHNGYLRRSQLKENDILFSIAGTLGRVTSVKSSILPANTNQALAIIRLKDGYLDYVKTYLKGKAVADFIKKNPTIGAQPNLSLEQVANLKISIPSEDEQERVGAFFHHLDNLITLHQRK